MDGWMDGWRADEGKLGMHEHQKGEEADIKKKSTRSEQTEMFVVPV